MSNALYDKGREAFLAGSLSWSSSAIKACLVTEDYEPNLGADQYLADIPEPHVVATSDSLTGKTVTAGVADAADVILPSVSGNPCNAIVIYQDSGSRATSRLIAYIGTASGLPVTPNGTDITLKWSDGPDKIFRL